MTTPPENFGCLPTSLPSSLIATMKLSVPMNGVLVPFKRCIDNLQRFCRPVMFHNDDPVFDLSCSGSSLLFRHRGRNLVLCTRHQLVSQGRDPKDIVLILDEPDGRKVALTPNEANRVIFPVPEQSNLEDIFIAEYHSGRNGRNLEPHFLSLDLSATVGMRSVPPEAIVLIFAIGYPTRFSSFETAVDADDGVTGLDVVSRWCKLYLETAEPSVWDHELRIPLRMHERYHADLGDPDGFSGSPVFFLYQDGSKQAHLGFAGMITHANREGRFLIYEAEHIRQVVAGLDV